jgi:hypothetical protein
MRALGLMILAGLTLTQTSQAQAPQTQAPQTQTPAAESTPVPTPRPVGTMAELMVRVIYPYSDAMFYIGRNPPRNDVDWEELQGKALALAEFGNLLMMPGRARDQDRWMRDARLLVEAGAAAYKATKDKNLEAVLALNSQLVDSCTSCHMHYRSNYGRRPPAQLPPQ